MYQIKNRKIAPLLVVAPIIAALCLSSACTKVVPTTTAAKSEHENIEKATDGSGYNRVTLSAKAAQRLDIQTVAVREEQVGGVQRLVIPYSAVLYGLHGETWAFTSPKSLTFVRQPITIDRIEGDRVILSNGPAAGTQIATVGVAELYGSDTGIGK
jgi:hypothetical protein